MNKLIKLIHFLIIISLFGCSTDIDLTTGWKDITIVYGLLNAGDTAQYIKVNKAFLDKETDALAIAQEFDSLYYQNINVTLEQWDNGSLTSIITLTEDIGIPKEPGIFSYPNQILYTTNTPINPNSIYKLHIINNQNGKVISAETPIVDNNFKVNKPTIFADKITWTSPFYTVKWESAANGKLYQLVIKFNYTEINTVAGDTSYKQIEWWFNKAKSKTTTGGKTMSIDIEGDGFYHFVHSQINPDPNMKRYSGNLDFVFYVGGEVLSTYMDVQLAQSGLVQAQTTSDYTNIEDGLGIFSSRTIKIIPNKTMSNNSIDSLACGHITKGLNFAKSDGSFACN